VRVTFINSWLDPAAAKEAALAQVDAGADVLFAERMGVIEAAVERDRWAFGNLTDQNDWARPCPVEPGLDMRPTVAYVLGQVQAGRTRRRPERL